MRQAIARRPRMQMLQARNWQRLFGERQETTLSLAGVVQRHPNVVLLGDPGSGKTTLCRWLVLQMARALKEGRERVQVPADRVRPGDQAGHTVDLGQARLPVFVRIADYARARRELGREGGDFLLAGFVALGEHHGARALGEKGLARTVVGAICRDFLEQGQALLVLDGLDEVADPGQRQDVMRAVNRLIEGESRQGMAVPVAVPTAVGRPANPVLLTSRVVGYQFRPLTHLPHYTVEDMDEAAIAAFCRAWIAHVAGSGEADSEGEKLKQAIFDHSHPGVRDLAGNQLLLTILAQVYWQSAARALPARRAALFAEAARAMYDQRERFWDQAGIPPLRLNRALAAVAAHLHGHEETGFAEEGTVRAQLATVLAPEQADAVLQAARDFSGFLIGRGEGVYAFLHRAVQEYFTALHLVAEPGQAVARLAERVLDPTWREPVLLGLALVSEPKYPDGSHLLAAAFSALLELSDPAGDFLPRRELLAAAACPECERVPAGAARRAAAVLLALHAQREARGKSPVLRRRIQQAFAGLYRSAAREATEAVLREALLAGDFERRYAAADLIIASQWDSRPVAEALVAAWRTWDSPAGSLLVALQGIYERQPDLFQPDFLPLRAGVTAEPGLWQVATGAPGWRAILRALYLAQGAPLTAGGINRDSPLTGRLLTALRSAPPKRALADLAAALQPLAGQPGTALGRDAALALAALGDDGWAAVWLEAGDQEGAPAKLRPLLAGQAFVLALALALDRARLKEIKSLIMEAQARWTADAEIVQALENAQASREAIGVEAGDLAPMARVWAGLLEAVERQPAPAHPANGPALASVPPELDEATLAVLAADLAATADARRRQARQALVTDRSASALEKAFIEKIASLASEHEGRPAVGTQMAWSLSHVKHDMVEWIETWTAEAATGENTPAEKILSSIHRATAGVPARLLALLPHPSPRVNAALLDSLSWLVRLKQIPEDLLGQSAGRFLDWLAAEGEGKSRLALLELLGHWRPASLSLVEALLAQEAHLSAREERLALYQSLARLAAREPALAGPVEAALARSGRRAGPAGPGRRSAGAREAIFVRFGTGESPICYDGRHSHAGAAGGVSPGAGRNPRRPVRRLYRR